jgi:hypothetical protein
MFIYVLLSIACFSIGLYLIIPGIIGVIYGRSSKLWPSVKGVITISKVVEDGEGGGTVKINYRYWIKNKSYLGKTVGFCSYGSRVNSANSIGDANYISNQLPKGSDVEVYYHPNKHYLAVLEPGFRWSAIPVIAFSLMFIVAGVFIAIKTLK